MPVYEPLTWWHGRRFGVLRIHPDVVGYAALEDGVVVAMLGAVEQAGEVWMFAAGPVRPGYHRQALRLLSELGAAGIERVWARPDPGIDKSEVWLSRLGFLPQETGAWVRGLSTGNVGERGELRVSGAADIVGGVPGLDGDGGGEHRQAGRRS